MPQTSLTQFLKTFKKFYQGNKNSNPTTACAMLVGPGKFITLLKINLPFIVKYFLEREIPLRCC